jgi:hypothetical protein
VRVFLHGGVEALFFVQLRVEIFDRLVVEQRIHGLRIGLVVGIVHRPADVDAPAGQREGEIGVACDHGRHDHHEPDVELPPQQHRDKDELQRGREDVEDRQRQQAVDRLGSPVDDARQPAGVPLEMEAQRQGMEMMERLDRDNAKRMVGDLRQHAVAQLRHRLAHDPGDPVADDEGDRDQDRDRPRIGPERIHRITEEIRRGDRDDRRQDQEQDRDHDPDAQVGAALRPQIGHEFDQRRPARQNISRPALLEAPTAVTVRRHAVCALPRFSFGTTGTFKWFLFSVPRLWHQLVKVSSAIILAFQGFKGRL